MRKAQKKRSEHIARILALTIIGATLSCSDQDDDTALFGDAEGLEEQLEADVRELAERMQSGEKKETYLDSTLRISAKRAHLNLLKADLLYDPIDFSDAYEVRYSESASSAMEEYLKIAIKKHDEAFKDRGFGEIKSKLPADLLGKILSVEGINIGADLSSVSNFLKSQGYHLPQNARSFSEDLKESITQQHLGGDRSLLTIDDGGLFGINIFHLPSDPVQVEEEIYLDRHNRPHEGNLGKESQTLLNYSGRDLTLGFDPANLLAIDALEGQLHWTLQFKCGYLVGITIRNDGDRKDQNSPGAIFCKTLKAKAIEIDEPHLIVSRPKDKAKVVRRLYITDPVYAMRLDLYGRELRIARKVESKNSLNDQITKKLGVSAGGSTKAPEQSPLGSDASKLISLIDLEFKNRGSTIVNDVVMRSLSLVDRFALLIADPAVNRLPPNGKPEFYLQDLNRRASIVFTDNMAWLSLLFALVDNEKIVDEYINCIHSIFARHYSAAAATNVPVIPISKEALTSTFSRLSDKFGAKQRGYFSEYDDDDSELESIDFFEWSGPVAPVADRFGNIAKREPIEEQTKVPTRPSRPSDENSKPTPEEQLAELKGELAALNRKMEGQRQQYKNAQAVINRLTNNRRTPVKENSPAYHQCVKASKIIVGIERGAPALKAKKAELEAKIGELSK